MRNTITSSRSRLHDIIKVEPVDKDGVPEIVAFNNDWGGIVRTPLLNFPRATMKNLVYRMFLGSPHIDGKFVPNSTICNYTEIEKDVILFRVRPCFSKKRCWYE